MTTIHADLTADREHLILIAAGADVYETAQAAQMLKTLTPLFSKSDPPGALLCPATWPAVVQLSAQFGESFVPGPVLQAWIDRQIEARQRLVAFDTSLVPAGLTPYPWQVEGARMIAAPIANAGALITDEPGTGKTITAILGLAQRQLTMGGQTPVVVVCPASVVDSWVEAWKTWAPAASVVAWRGPKRKTLADSADVYVTSYETARQDCVPSPGFRPLLDLKPVSLVIDECFPAGTVVETPYGPCAIEHLRPGDEVVGVDHATGLPVETTVRHVFERTTDEDLVTVNGVEMTPNHPVWTARGYAPAAAVRRTDQVCATLINCTHDGVHADVRVVRADVHEDRQAERSAAVLRPELLGEVAHVRPGVRRVARHPEEADRGVGESASLAGEPRGSGAAGRAPERPGQSAARPRGAGTLTRDLGGEGLADADGRQRTGDRASAHAGRGAGLGCGVLNPDRTRAAVPEGLQGRPSRAIPTDRDRGGRAESQVGEGQGDRRPSGRAADRDGVDSSPILEPGSDRGPRVGAGSSAGRRVFNIETGTGNYVAGGLLVHNCHLIKNPRAERTKAVQRLSAKAKCVVLLSGTPITHHPGDLWPGLKCLVPGAYPSGERNTARYCIVVPGDYKDENLGLNRFTEPEFRLSLMGQFRRVAKADVLTQLPPKVYSTRTVDLPREWRKAYDDFEAQMFAEMPDGADLSVMDTLSMLTHLSSLSSAAADVRVEFGPDVDQVTGELKRHVHLDLKAPSWKVDALLEVLEERPGSPVVTFAPRRELVMLAGAAAEKAGLRVGYVVGGQSAGARTEAVSNFQSGNLDLICATTGAGGVGLTLTAARTVVFLQRPFALVESIQAEDRCHRIGSEIHDSIEVIDVIARSTLDTRVRAVLRERAGQLAELVQDPRIVAELLGGSNVTRLDTRRAS